MTLGPINANPADGPCKEGEGCSSGGFPREDDVDALNVFDFVMDIRDPEHPHSLEQLSVLLEEPVTVDEMLGRIQNPNLHQLVDECLKSIHIDLFSKNFPSCCFFFLPPVLHCGGGTVGRGRPIESHRMPPQR